MITRLNTIGRALLSFFNVLAVFFLLLTLLAVYVSPITMGVLSFVGFAFPVLWIINLFFFVYWLVKRKKRLILSALAILISWSQWNGVFQISGSNNTDKPASELSFSVMTYNVRMFDNYVWSGDKQTPEKIYKFIHDKNPDVLCLQEFFTHSSSTTFSENTILARFRQYPYRHIEYNIKRSNGKSYGLATFSKYPIVAKKPLFFLNTNNFSIQTDITIKGKSIRVFNNHLESVRLGGQHYAFIDNINHKTEKERIVGVTAILKKLNTASAQRAKQAETIREHVKNSTLPAVVCGDFNDTPVSYVYHNMRGQLKDAFIESGKGFGGTYNGLLPSFRIDFIFYDPSFKSYNFNRFKVDYSDHFPIMTQLVMESK